MRDARVSVWTNPSIVSNSVNSVTGPTIDLLGSGYVGDHKQGTELYGIGVEIINGAVTGADADGFLLIWKWQVAPDSSGSPGTWVDGMTIGTVAWDATKGWTKDGTLAGATLGLTRAKLQSRLRTAGNRFARLVVTGSDLSDNTASISLRAYLSDGTHPHADSGIIT